ncbi:hypothetical protein [Sinanaerobacter chloroacetimidivorans]|uniref:Uncharacterized protein n=1 Tax=Sinanaerobacter chloroacetimidivorans TaxID=2818044 RepID=A0A8J7W615_9FIRM|nr:hypothetical protein [Sinanaerobacter chloroacetimidivorans]MBR0599570.1 hypothetical protein [Sinanaerobacter chloroacetimidivorans]
MRYALVDDATLQAVKRLEGKIAIKSRHSIDGDILALENLLQAILFYDKVLYVDDNDAKNRKSRKKLFEKFPVVSLDSNTLKEMMDHTNHVVDDLIPCIEGGSFTDESFSNFFRSMKLNLKFTWDMKSNVYYLTQKIQQTPDVDVSLNLKLLGMLYTELSDKSFIENINERRPLLYDSFGQIINNQYRVCDMDGKEHETKISKQAEALFSALNCLAYRTTFYTLLAKELKADSVLSPIRSAFQRYYLKKLYTEDRLSDPSQEEAAAAGRQNSISAIDSPVVLKHSLPLFSLWIAERMKGGASFIDAAYELREDNDFVLARLHLNEIDGMLETGHAEFVKFVNSIISELDKQMDRIMEKYMTATKRGTPVSSRILTGNLAASAEGFPLLKDFTYCMKPASEHPMGRAWKSRFGAVNRYLTEDLMQLDALGEFYDIITSKIVYEDETYLHNIKVINNELTYENAWWTIAM